MFDIITFIKQRKYRPLYRYIVSHATTRRAFAKQLSSCLQFQLLIIKLYCLYKNHYKPFLEYISLPNASSIILNKIAKVITSVDEVAFSLDLQRYVSRQRFTNSSTLDQIHTIIDHPTRNIHPCIIYYKEPSGEDYIVLHYFTIIYSNNTYWLVSSWGDDSLCIMPAIIEIDLAEFTTLLSLLSDHDTRRDNNQFAMLMTKYFFSTPYQHRPTNTTLASDIDYYGGIIPGYIEEIDRLIENAIKSQKPRNRTTFKKPRNRTTFKKPRNRTTFKKPRTTQQTRKKMRRRKETKPSPL